METVVTSSPQSGAGAKTQFVWGAVILLFLALVVPVAQAPFIGSVNVFSIQDGSALWFLGFAISAAAAAYFKRYRLLWLPGVLVLGTVIVYVYRLEKAKADFIAGTQGNLFSGLAAGMASTIHLQWGIALLIIAPVALVVASFLGNDAATLRGLFLANKKPFLEGAAGIAAIFLTMALAPSILPHTSSAAQSTDTGSNANAPATADSNAASDASTTPPSAENPKIQTLRGIVSVGVLDKGFHTSDIQNGDYEDKFTVTLQYHNLGTKTIAGVKGGLKFIDQFGKTIETFNVQYEQTLRPGEVATEDDRYDYNRFEDSDNQLRATALSKMKIEWDPSRVNFADGSSASVPE